MKTYLQALSLGCASFVIAMSAGEAYAQVIAPSVQPGQIQKRFQKPSPLKVAPELPMPVQGETAPSKEMQKVRFTLKGVTIKGAKTISDAELASFYKDRIGKETSLGDLQGVASAITAHYRNEGYILSRAYIPAQRIENGVVRIEIMEGRIGKVTVEGIPNDRRSLIQDYAEKMKRAPLSARDLERYLLLIDDLPGITARGILKPSASERGAADLVVTIEEDKFEGAIGIDNRGTKYVGPFQTTAMAAFNSVLGLHERTTVRSVISSPTEELQYFDITHEETVGTEGTRVIGTFAYTHTKPGFILKPLEVEAENISAGLEVSHPFIRSRNQNLFGVVGYTYSDAEVRLLSTEFTEDRLHVINLGTSYDVKDRLDGVSRIEGRVHQGLTDEGQGLRRSRFNGESDFTKFTAEALRQQPIWRNIGVLTGVRGQYSLDPLLASQEFDLGGEEYARAYDPSEVTGDHGLALKIELNYGNYVGHKYFQSYQLYTYYDLGAVWNEDPLAGEPDKQSLASTGLGIRSNVTDAVSGYVELAFPLTHKVGTQGADDGHDPRLFVGLTTRF
ncbi:MAG: hxuB 3 [Rickettsiales bacterium]|jgi:hemolysin activation/secretion protein|nr:hxuB 3 [Rickettsiales bacterium]